MNKHFASLDTQFKFEVAKVRVEKLKLDLDSFTAGTDNPYRFEVGKIEFVDALNYIMTQFNVGLISFEQLCILLAMIFEVLERINDIENEYFQSIEKDLEKALRP